MLLPPGAKSHSFEPAPQDIIRIRNLFIYVGDKSDAWIKNVLECMDTSEMTVITLMDCAEAAEEAAVEGMQADAVSMNNHAVV